ncbi:XPG domain containing-domain-containing protein [Apodospora peruviana]|uniref:XPG domain containing-domain-containing protein n=1 Tax=Apodospora peruviana TaxID=516989 RepID=A0AAE0I4T0_9PEZI|nr:XPG domain containing-domain-containing protein [Apodospora peruviana]
MGIPRLKRYLEPLAERAGIPPCELVIDGPALAYHILGCCMKGVRSRTPHDQPSNEQLGQTAVAWLDQIQACGLSVSAIYFDGFLPEWKHEERINRLLKLSQNLRVYYEDCPAGIPTESPSTKRAYSWGAFSKGTLTKTPPPPPFLVPAIIDALCNSARYASLTTVKPGEADVFCAGHVREHGGTVLTSDSDLLVYDLGSDSSVIFFSDIEINTASDVLTALSFRPSDICKRLSIKSANGLRRLAFEIVLDCHQTLEQAAERTRREAGTQSFPRDYSKFLEQYFTPVTASITENLSLDPRMSELVLQCIYKPTEQAANNSELAMHLPFLLDSPLRTSAWEASKPIRQLVYGLVVSLKERQRGPSPSVSEYRRLQTPTRGTRIDVPHPASVFEQQVAAFLDVLSRIGSSVSDQMIIWTIVAIHQDILLALHQGKTNPLSLELLRQGAVGTLNDHSWDFLHFLAQVQATYYSLRMLRQSVDFTTNRGGSLSDTMAKLGLQISTLPQLADFPSAKTFAGLLDTVKEAGGLSCLAALSSDYKGIVRQIEAIQAPPQDPIQEKYKAPKRKINTEHGWRAGTSPRNPFGVLPVSE